MTVVLEKQMKLSLQDLQPSVVVREDDQRMTTLGESSWKTNNLVTKMEKEKLKKCKEIETVVKKE